MKPSLVITVDTEPDDQWAPPRPDGTLPPFTFANTRGLARLIDVCRALSAPVTWLTSHAVAEDEASARVLARARDEGDEIGGHLHGWETPPFLAVDRSSRPFIGEYPPELRLAKHRSLLAAHEAAFGARPVSYRAGRWGIDALELQHLAELGYEIDSSLAPGIDFRDRAGLHQPGPDFRRFLTPEPPSPVRAGPLWEVPASLVLTGALGRGPAATALARAAANRDPGAPGRRSLSRLLAALALQELIWIRPLRHPRPALVAATRACLEWGAPIVNVMFHSSEAFAGTSPLSRRPEDVERLLGDLAAIVETAKSLGAVPRTLRDAVAVHTAASTQTRSHPVTRCSRPGL
ncbi:MAG TPA: hypothetical protein VLX28_15735, partial [Thermoanaerobaculia bacterium]|nr:hypothetical protein [Thermoanaerobaculia bacterium]